MPQLMRLAARIFNVPLMAGESYARTVVSVLAPRLGVRPMLDGDGGHKPAHRPACEPMLTPSGIYILPIVGGLQHRGDDIDAASGLASYTNLTNEIRGALDNNKVRAILLDIDSSGGEVSGCFELAETIADARKLKPIWAIANGKALSAAYMLFASASRCFVPKSGQVGSIGVVCLHVDLSRKLDAEGITPTIIFAGKHKKDGNSLEPLGDDVQADIQASVNQAYTIFVEQVAKHRPLDADAVRATEARVYGADDAKRLKLVDGVESFQGVMQRLEASLADPASRDLVIAAQAEEEDPAMNYTQQQLDAAVAAARVEASAQATATANAAADARVAQATADGYAAGRTDAATILNSEHAKGKTATAAALIADASMKPDKATGLLATMAATAPAEPVQPPGVLATLLKDRDPKVEGNAGNTTDEEKRAARAAELKGLGTNASRAVPMRR